MSKCANHFCDATAKAGQLACRDCWFRLPAKLRAAINETWRKRASGGLGAYSENVLEARRLWGEDHKAAKA